MKKKLTIVALVATFSLIAALVGAVWVKTRPAKSYADMDAFSTAWKACPEEDRHEMLHWLLGEAPTRHTSYAAENTKLYGLSRDEVLHYLGTNKSTSGNTYFIGSIENDIIGNLIVPKRDHLSLRYDDDGVIESIKTIS